MNIDWNAINNAVKEKLDSINLLHEMKDGRENIRDLMDRLEAKYPFEYTHPQLRIEKIVSLFDCFDEFDFQEYINKRYNCKECYAEEYSRIDIWKFDLNNNYECDEPYEIPECYVSNENPYSLCIGKEDDECNRCCLYEHMEENW